MTTPYTESSDVYKTAEYQRLAAAIKEHYLKAEELKQLEQQFPAENQTWAIYGTGTPRRVHNEE